jgi:hypothetical protein
MMHHHLDAACGRKALNVFVFLTEHGSSQWKIRFRFGDTRSSDTRGAISQAMAKRLLRRRLSDGSGQGVQQHALLAPTPTAYCLLSNK